MRKTMKLINIGFGNVVIGERVVAIITSDSAPIKRLKDRSREQGKLIDASHGRRTRSIIVTDSDHVILSAIQPETIAARFKETQEEKPNE